MPAVDTHIHLDVLDGWTAGDALATDDARAVVPGILPTRTRETLARLGEDKRLEFGVALHPWYCLDPAPEDLTALETLARDERVGWIGETGLDHLRHESGEARRDVEASFRLHLELAHAVEKPVIVHCVRAHHDCLRVLADMPATRGIIHAYGGSLEQVREFRRLGYVVGFGCAVTRERSKRVRRAAREVAVGDFVLETDAPFMAAGSGGHGEGQAADLNAVAAAVAELRGVSIEELWADAAEGLSSIFSGSRGAAG